MRYFANDKYRAKLRASFTADPPDGSLLVTAVPNNVPTIVTVGWNSDLETVISVQGKSGHDATTYALTGVKVLRGYGLTNNLDAELPVNCLNNEEFFNQYATSDDIINIIYPVGSIYISTVSTNPGTLFGVGTWTAFGAGRTLVGLDSGDSDFNTVEKTGGAKTHTLTVAEMPSHEHINGAGTATVHQYVLAGGNSNWPFGGGTVAQQRELEAVGGGGAHNNLQPYIVTYFWKRTA